MVKRFESPNILSWIIGPGIFIFLFLLGHYPNVIPFSYLGVLGGYLNHLAVHYHLVLVIVFWALILAHGYEAIVARRICHQLKLDGQSTVLWMVQTFILGSYSFVFD
jgi:hypothetical protein